MSKKNKSTLTNPEQQPNIGKLVSMERELLQQIIIVFCHYKDSMDDFKLCIHDDLTKHMIDGYILPGITNMIQKLVDLNNQPLTDTAPGRAFRPKN